MALVRRSGSGSTNKVLPATAYFDGDGVQMEFVIPFAYDVKIAGVFVGGQRMREGVDYNKDDDTKTVTMLFVVGAGIGIDVEYFAAKARSFDYSFDEFFG